MTRNAPNYKKEETEGRSLHEVRGKLILSLTLTLTLTLALALTLNPALTQP